MSRQRLAVGLAALAAAMCVTAMLLYPGGTPLDRAASGYSLTQNFLSDLGMTTSYGGGSNRGGATLFVFSILALVADSVVSLRPFVRGLLRIRESRSWAAAAATCVLLSCVAFTGVAFTPENRAMSLHIGFTVWGWRILALLSFLLGIAAARAGGRYARAAAICFATGVLLTMYLTIFMWGPDGDTRDGRMLYMVSQKIAVMIVVGAMLLLSRVEAAVEAR